MSDKNSIKTYFTSLKLENVRCFDEEFCLDLIDENGKLNQWTLLLGDNGVGKTTLLQCLGWMRPVLVDTSKEIASIDDKGKILKDGFLGAALQNEENDVLERLRRIGDNLTFELSAEMYQGDKLEFGSSPNGKKITTRIKYFFDKKKYLKEYEQTRIGIETKLKGSFTIPTIVAYGANRQLGKLNIRNVELEDSLAIDLSVASELYDAEERLTNLHYATIDKEPNSKEHNLLNTFKEVLTKILPEVGNASDIIIDPPELVDGELKESKVRVNTFPAAVPLASLSLGYQTTAAWALDLAWRLYHSNPESENLLEEPAIVLIDELDLHLHPRWQARIMTDLASIFKQTQFIATAHSPLMVQFMPNANFAIIQKVSKNTVKIENEPDKVQGWSVDQILNSQYFDLNISNKPKTQQLFKERNRLIMKKDRTEEETKRLEEIEEQILMVATPVILEKGEIFNSLKKEVRIKYDTYCQTPDIPNKLAVDGLNQTNNDKLAYDSNKQQYIYKGKNPKKNKNPKKLFEGKSNIYGCLNTVKPVLLTAQNYKCCYCEKYFLAANLHVEHYRPKTRVQQAEGEDYLYPGYYWLAYKWDNLFLACHDCNSSYKKSLFPLENPNRRARSHRGLINREKPLLIKPSDDARIHIRFNLFGQPEPRTTLGDQTIIDLGLLRDSLIKARLTKLIELLKDRADVEDNPAPVDMRERRKIALKRRSLFFAKTPDAEFSAMANDVLDVDFDTVEHLLKLEAMLKRY